MVVSTLSLSSVFVILANKSANKTSLPYRFSKFLVIAGSWFLFTHQLLAPGLLSIDTHRLLIRFFFLKHYDDLLRIG